MRLPLTLSAAGVTLYLLVPGPTQSLLGSWPLTPLGVVALITALGTLALVWRTGVGGDRQTGWAFTLAALIIVRVVAGFAETPAGWMANYYANAKWEGQPEWSSDFRFEHATRIDPALAFTGTEFPTFYLNDARFTSGVFREVTEPMTVEWSGAFDAPAAMDVAFDVRANGSASVAFDGAPPVFSGDAGGGRQHVEAGRHLVTVRYLKPAAVEGAFHASLRGPDGFDLVVSPSLSVTPSASVRFLATGFDIIVLGVLVVAFALGLRNAWRSSHQADSLVAVGLILVLGLQGLVTAHPMLGRFLSLSGGDDWLGFESRARDILQHGPLMTLGRPLGEGVAYFYHPFYSYVLAAVHAIAGESLFGPIFMHFVILAVTASVMWSFARQIFGTAAAACGLAALLVVFELDFIRYYTITLLSENFYVLTVTLCLYSFAKWARSGGTSALIQAGLWAGLSSATRPAMMMFLGPAAIVAVVIAAKRLAISPFAAPLILVASWLAVVAPFTLRNWVVARKVVLISDGLGGGFIVHNVPTQIDPASYLQGYGGGVLSSIGVLWRILLDHPIAVLTLQVKKLGFTLGMVHWFGDYRPHPELVAITGLYGVMVAVSPLMRSAVLWPVHAFVLSHVASMALTSPWNYGYRLILPPYVYTSTFAVAAAVAWLRPVADRRAPMAGAPL